MSDINPPGEEITPVGKVVITTLTPIMLLVFVALPLAGFPLI